jgi:hypothetical protein
MEYLPLDKKTFEEYQAHQDKLAPVPLPEKMSDLRVGKKCVVPPQFRLAAHWKDGVTHKDDSNQVALQVCAETLKHVDHVDSTSGHKLDLKNKVSKLPSDWKPEVSEIITP